MQTALVCLCLCLLNTALSTPVPLPGRVAGNCVGQHRILLKGCNAKHGFYVFKYVYSFSTRRNQTQIKDQKEEADSHSVVPGYQLSEDKTEDEVAPEQGDNDSTDVMENRIGLKPENHSTPAAGGDAHSPRLGTDMRVRGGINIAGSTPASSEGSGDLDLVTEVNSGVSILTQSPGEAMAGNRSDVSSEDRGIPVEGAMTALRERVPTPGGAGNEGSGDATIPGQRHREGIETGGAALTSITEKMEDVQVDAEGVDEYAYIPDAGSVTVTRGKAGSIVGATSITHISPDKDDEVNIFIGRANIHVGEQENTHAGVTVGSKDDGISTAGTSSSLPRLGITVTHNSGADDGIPAQRQFEVLATTATLSHRDSTTTSPRDGHPTGDDEDGATIIGDGEGPVAPSPWQVTGGDITVPVEAGIHENGDGEAKGEVQKSEEKPRHIAVTIPYQAGDKEATPTAKGAGIHLGTIVASPRVSEGDCTTTLGMTGGHKSGKSAMGGSKDVGPASPQPHKEAQPGVGVKVPPGGAGQEKTPRMNKVLSPRGKAGSQASSGAQASAGGRGGDDTVGRSHATQAGRRPAPQAGQAGSSVAVGEGQQWERSGKARVVVAGAKDGHIPRHHGRKLGAGVPGEFAVLGHSRQLDQVKRDNEFHVHERSFYTLGGAAGGPRVPYIGLGSADSSQSSEGERGSHSDSRQTELQPSRWGTPGHSHGRWSQGTL